jgi:hypothetical protein
MAAPFVHAVIVRRTSRTLLFASFYAAATVMLWVSVAKSSSPGVQYNTLNYIGIVLAFIVTPLATIHAFHIRRLVFSTHEKTDGG